MSPLSPMTRARSVATAALALSLGLALASCSEDAEPTSGDTEESPTVASTPASPSSSPSQTPSSSEPTATVSVSEEPSETMTPEPSVDVAGLLLPAGRVGKLNAEWTWLAGNQFDIEPEGLVSCHRFGMEVVGADKVAVREYTSDLDANVRAHHLVAGFADDVTARRAYSVLESWRASCQKRLEQKAKGRDGIRVSDADRVSGAGDSASSYLVVQPSPTGSSLLEDVAFARDGSVIHLAVVELEGDDYNYPRGRTPAAVAVRNAAG